jgi:hypothetical protein
VYQTEPTTMLDSVASSTAQMLISGIIALLKIRGWFLPEV